MAFRMGFIGFLKGFERFATKTCRDRFKENTASGIEQAFFEKKIRLFSCTKTPPRQEATS